MLFSKTRLLFAALATVYSFTSVVADESTITPAPTPTAGSVLEARQVAGGPGTPILSTLHYQYTALPYQVYPFAALRGPQSGYNICNSTTEGPSSLCQTLIVNDIDDFCLWGSDIPGGFIGNEEARVVAYCTKHGHGTRIIPGGAITGLQFMKTPGYIQIWGYINNAGLNLDPTDEGGELDPHGADLQGNPLGGVVFSNGTTDSTNGVETQVFNWNMFVGGGQFCLKACYNTITSPDYCLNTYDLLGCGYNMPSNAQDGQFSSCEGDVQDVVGVYTSNGQTITWSMPNPLTTNPPYTPRVPASSQCTTFSSEQLFAAASSTASSSTTVSVTLTGSITKASSTPSKSASSAAPTKSTSGAVGMDMQLPGILILGSMTVAAFAGLALL